MSRIFTGHLEKVTKARSHETESRKPIQNFVFRGFEAISSSPPIGFCFEPQRLDPGIGPMKGSSSTRDDDDAVVGHGVPAAIFLEMVADHRARAG